MSEQMSYEITEVAGEVEVTDEVVRAYAVCEQCEGEGGCELDRFDPRSGHYTRAETCSRCSGRGCLLMEWDAWDLSVLTVPGLPADIAVAVRQHAARMTAVCTAEGCELDVTPPRRVNVGRW